MSHKPTKISIEEWINHTSYELIQQNIEIIRSFSKNYDLIIFNKLLASFIGNMIEMSLKNTLYNESPDLLSKEHQFQFVSRHFADLKGMIQLHIGDAFGKAMSEFSGKECEYYCEVKMVPEPKSKVIN